MGHDDATPEAPATAATPTGRAVRSRRGWLAAGAATGLVLAGFGVASAQETSSTTAPDSKSATAGAKPFPGRMMVKGHHGFGRFGGMGIHGEFTVPNRDGGYQTVAHQVGEVTSVNDSSIEVKSEDGFTRRYDVDDDTLVNAGRDGIADVKTGDRVRLSALVEDGDAVATQVADITNLERIREKRGFRGPR